MPTEEPTTSSDRSAGSRLALVSRRRFLAAGSALAGALVMPGLACASDDAAVFAAESSTSTVAASAETSTASTTATTTASTAGATSTAQASSDQASAAQAGTFPAGAELAVSFTFEPGSGGRGAPLNPYIAVWVEDASGNLVDTISVWYQQGGKGDKWLDDLRSWYSTSDGSADAAVVGATRVAGSYTVAWDGTDLADQPVPQGEYVLYVEAVREHGPYEITSVTMNIGEEPFIVTLPDEGELSALSAELIV